MTRIPVTFPAPAPVPIAYTVSGLARDIGVTRQTVWRMCATGQIKKGAYGLIPRASVEKFFERQMQRIKAARKDHP